MTRRNNNARRQYVLMHTLCCIIFCVFVFLYLYFYQGDIMAMAQHVLSGGATTYDNLIGASVITAVMLVIHTFMYSLLHLDRWFYWLTYLPSFLVMAVLTDIAPDGNGTVYNNLWLWLAPLVLVVYIIMVRLFSEVDSLGKDSSPAGMLFSKIMWTNILSITVMMLIVVGTGNTDVTFHHRVKVENRILSGDYEEALNVGRRYSDTDASLTMLRAYALAVCGELPGRLFEYPVVGGSSSLRPNGKNVKSIMIHNSDIAKFIHTRKMGTRSIETDYKLCGLLADCNLNSFSKELKKHYVIDSSLPRYYKEALLVTSHKDTALTKQYADSTMMSDYSKFLKISRRYPGRNELRVALKDNYSDTYWYYYACNRKK